MSEWIDLKDAPKNEPVTVWASYDPSNPTFSFREKRAVNIGYGWWKEFGRNGTRLYPTHWKPLAPPNP